MPSRQLHANSSFAQRHDGVRESDHVDAVLEQSIRHGYRFVFISEHDRNDRMLARKQREPSLSHPGAELFGVRLELGAAFGTFGHEVEGLDRTRNHGWRDGVREQVRAGTLTQQLNYLGVGADVTTGCPTQGFAERARDDVDAVGDATVLGGSRTGLADEADSVRIIDHNHRVVLLGKVADRFEWGEVAVHREHAVGDDEATAGILRGNQLRLKVGHVAVLVAVAGGLGETNAVDDRGVVELVRNYGILGSKQHLKDAAIGIEARGEQDGRLHAQQGRKPVLEFHVLGLRAANEPHTCHAEAPIVEGVLGGGNQARVVGQPKVVVGAEVEHGLAGRLHVR